MKEYLPKAFSIGTGLILSSEGEFSNQADLLIADQLNNAPLYPESNNKLWLVESIYSLIEVKTNLEPLNIKDAIKKCVKFKRLKRVFQNVPSQPRITDSLFILWAFNGPDLNIEKKTLAIFIRIYQLASSLIL